MSGKLTISIYSFYRFCIFVCTCIMLGFFLLFPTEIIGGYTSRFIIGIIGCLIAPTTLCIKNPVFLKYKKKLDSISIVYSLCVLIAIINTQCMYHYSIYELSIAVMPFLYFYFAYPLLYLFCRDGGVEKTLSMVTNCVLVFLGIKTVIWFLYVFGKVIVFHQLLFEYGDTWVRNGVQRINAGYLVGIALAFCVTKGFSQKKRNLYKVLSIFIILYVWFIAAFRFQFIATIITLIACVYFTDNNRSKTLNRLIILALILVASFSPFMFDLIDSFSSSNEVYGASTTIRFLTFDHFYQLMIDRNPILGLGLLISENPITLELIRKSQWRLYYIEDIGIIGSWFKFGILTIGIYGQILYLGIKDVFDKRRVSSVSKMMLIGIVVYLFFSSLMLSIFDLQRAYDVPFYLAIVCYYHCEMNVKGTVSKMEVPRH